MAEVRIPVSLKFNDESDFYNDFVLDMRENKTLSGFIVEILEAYYTDEGVRDTFLRYQDANNPLLLIKERLQNIQTEHTRTMLTTSALSGNNNKIMEEMQGVVPLTNPTSTNPTNQPNLSIGSQQSEQSQPQQTGVSTDNAMSLLTQRIENLEHLLPSINDKLTQLLQSSLERQVGVSNEPQTPPTQQAELQQVYQVQQSQSQLQTQSMAQNDSTVSVNNQNMSPTQSHTDIYSPSAVVEQEIHQVTSQPPSYQGVASQPSVVPPSIVMSDEQSVMTEVEDKPKGSKAPSFGKALSSLKKK